MGDGLQAIEDWRDLYARIGTLLFDNGLEPSPDNYLIGHRYLHGNDTEFKKLVEQSIQQNGRLTADAAVTLTQRSIEVTAADLAQIADQAQTYLEQVAGVVGQSGEDARAYGAALRNEVNELEAGAAPLRAVDSLLAITREMIEKSRAAEEHLRRTRGEIDVLRGELAAASRKANSDALTGLPNRRAMDARLRSAIERARRTRRPLSLAICDIDHFKSFNDLHGHQIGDEVIKFVATSLGKHAGEERFVGRYGGEEFVLLFEGLDATAAAAETDHMRAAIHSRELKVTATGRALGKLAISAGVATLAKGDSAATLVKRADTALYQAKNSGRNRVCIAEDQA